MATDSDWRAAIEAHRERRDEYFREDPHSPIPPGERATFDGLEYYPPAESYRYVLPLSEYAEKEAVTVATSTDGEWTYRRWGEFRFDVEDTEVTLQAYRADPDEEGLWVPFRDATSGEETYGAGRYLDLAPEAHRRDDGEWILDFNEAYNPTCAYSDRYECPLPPTGNWLTVPIEAGERAYR